MSPRGRFEEPTPAQVEAADPARSAWVSANAGSGKTRVLTQRVARLLLAGAAPERILCLTYTKAAAAEMEKRLFETLGGWAMADDETLGRALAAIAGARAPVTDAEELRRARRLFAAALDTPGGLKIQTIHAFCDALLRRFPLEAGVSPRFEVIDDRQRALLLDTIRAALALAAERRDGRGEPAGADAFDRVAARLDEGGLDGLVGAILAGREYFGGMPVAERLAAHYGACARTPPEDLARAALAELDWAALARFAEVMEQRGGAGGATASAAIREAAARREDDPLAAAEGLARAFLTARGEPRSRNGFPTQAVLAAWPEADALADKLIDWAGRWRETRLAAETVARTRDLGDFATALLERYEAAKAARGLLDFDDLVERAGRLLEESDMAAWVLWRLDRGIDHILVDEAQDTAPAQWRVIRAIAREFHAGHGAREAARPDAPRRTIFAVGDEKQSIYSFQGAEPESFDENRRHFRDWLGQMGEQLAEPELLTSFRSAPGILRFVDRVFAGDAAAGLTPTGTPVRHVAFRTKDAARIDLWPLVGPEADPDEERRKQWWEPPDRPPPGHPKARLARILAAEIARMLAEERLPARGGWPGRRVRPGDVMVLVTKRDLLATALIRELKGRGVPVAGADRLNLVEELAVLDLLALIRVAVTPGDDLSLAALLRSPLFGLGEAQLFDLAHGRPGTLWEALLAAEARHGEAVAVLRDMMGLADFLRPYEFLERVLIRHDGRRRLLARLGREAEDPIDELLAQALEYEARETPSLAGFLAWLEAAEIEVKREMQHGTDEVRVLTVHGAKGLEAPVVILPDCMAEPGGGRGPTLLPLRAEDNRPGLLIWAGRRDEDDARTRAAREAAERRAAAERQRLLYVALTRAEDWLVIAGAGREERAGKLWYGQLRRAAEEFGGFVEVAGPDGLGAPILRFEDNPVPVTGAPPEEAPKEAAAPVPPVPAWAVPAPREERPARLSPSALLAGAAAPPAGAAEGAPEAAAHGADIARLRGTVVHRLLERLPEVFSGPSAGSPAAGGAAELGRRLLAAEFPGLEPALAESALAEALAVLDAPFAAEVFGPDSLGEVALRIDLPGFDGFMEGRIDRLVIGEGRVRVIDFKTDAAPPEAPGGVPTPYLAQLAAYREAAAAIWPGRAIEAAILWTAGPRLMPLPAALLDAALAAARAAAAADAGESAGA